MRRRRRHRHLLRTLAAVGWKVDACYVFASKLGCYATLGGDDGLTHRFWLFGQDDFPQRRGLPPFPHAEERLVFVLGRRDRPDVRSRVNGWPGLAKFINDIFEEAK